MTVREELNLEEPVNRINGRGLKGPRKYKITILGLAVIIAVYAFSITFAIVLTYNFGICPDLNVQTEICDKKNVIPITIPLNNATNPTIKEPQFEEDLNLVNRTNIRLPKTMHPISYELKLIPFLFEGNFTFEGDVRIKVNVTTNCKNVTLHAIGLNIKETQIWKIENSPQTETRTSINISDQKVMVADQFFVIIFPNDLEANSTYEINIKYNGTLNENLQGFYRSSYAVNGTTRWLAATQFQPTDARRAFPCFDEPAYKATFKLWIARLFNMTTLSNMPKIGQPIEIPDLTGYSYDEFQESLPMSTYLVAFVVSDFKNLTDGNFSVWARPSAIESARYALEVGPKILRFFETYFNISYPLPKLDMIALPDFGAGAMENWGLVTFREVTMLHDPVISAPLNKQRVATIIAHELAHQWFGNLVTPVWWSDLWLNEGFASYMEFVGANFINPQWKTMDQFVCNELQNVFNSDSLASSHKISVEVHDPDSINEIFDRISYGKGAAIIRMMEHFLTIDVFKAGLNSYLTEKAYNVATQDDLWSHLTQRAQMSNTFDNLTNVKQIMDTWTTQMGFPVITVNRNYSTNMVNFTQNRFTFVPSNQWKKLNMAFKESLWWVPISYTMSNELDFNDTKPDEWIRGTEQIELPLTNLTDIDWILVNIQSTGYYRVNYDERNWNLLDSWLQDPKLYTKIVPTNRAQIIDDSLALARAGKLDYRIALNLTRYLKHENEYVPWRSALGSVNFIDKMMSSGPKYDLFKKYFIDLIENIYQRTSSFENKTDDDPLTAYLRVEVMTFACRLGHSDCITKSVALFERWMNATDPDKENLIPSNIRSIVYGTAIKHGDEREWDFMWNRYMNATVSSEKELLLDAMSSTREHWILNRYLERSLTENSGIRKQDLVRVFVTVSNNAIGLPITFNFLRSNWDRLREYLGPPMMNLYILLSYTFQNANTAHDLDMFERFVNENIEGKSRTISQVIENLKININWMEKNSQTIVQWLGNVTQTSQT